jgi:transposase-like protein
VASRMPELYQLQHDYGKTRLMHPGCFRYTCHDCGNTYTAGYVTTFSQRRHLLWVGMARLMSGLQMDPGALSRMSTIMH